jgi:hypothetical protein
MSVFKRRCSNRGENSGVRIPTGTVAKTAWARQGTPGRSSARSTKMARDALYLADRRNTKAAKRFTYPRRLERGELVALDATRIAAIGAVISTAIAALAASGRGHFIAKRNVFATALSSRAVASSAGVAGRGYRIRWSGVTCQGHERFGIPGLESAITSPTRARTALRSWIRSRARKAQARRPHHR